MSKDLTEKETVTQTGRMSAEDRRMQILQVAIGLFSRCGFSGTTTKQIANGAGISEAIIFRHFSTKDELYHAILDHLACEGGLKSPPWESDETHKRAAEEKDDFTFFYSFALHALRHQQSDVEFMRLLFHSALEGHELASIFFEQFITPIYDYLCSYIKARQADGAFRQFEPRVAVRAFMGMLIHHSLNNILWDKRRRILDISNEDAAREFAAILLQGIKK